jgi:hypothetical protein
VTIDDLLNQIQPRLGLEAETEHEVLEEIRGHLEEAVAARNLPDGESIPPGRGSPPPPLP